VARAERLGARVLRGVAVDHIDLRPDGVDVIANGVTYRARHAVISVGSWLGKLLPELSLPLRVTRQIPGWYPVERPELFTPDRFPVFLRDIADRARPGDVIASDSTFYGFPTLDGKTIKVAIHREGPLTDPDELDRTVTREELSQVQEYIERFLVGVGTEPVQTQVCMYTNTPDHDFLIGSPPGMHQLTILGGFSGHGFKFAPVMGEIGADLATKGTTEHPVDFLSLRRFAKEAPHASAR
ncbi:MAG TPA: FAD-dependent oxidoreductase, partial [Chloroflexota bacterium]